MVVLALETVTRAGSVALLVDGSCASMLGDPSRMHGERLPGELLAWLERHGRRLRDVDRFAVVTGPGSFTGLRVGIAVIQGLAIASGRTIVPMPTLDAMAVAWIGSRSASSAPASNVVACLDGHRGEVFSAAWRVTGSGGWPDADAVLAPRVSRPAELAGELHALSNSAPVVMIGDGARKYAAAFEGIEIVDVPVPLAEVAARHAFEHPDLAVAPHALRPVYIRRPDAVLARERSAQGVPSSRP